MRIAPARLRTTGLGSCVCLVLWDRWAAVGGMAHIMLPDTPRGGGVDPGEEGRYVRTAVPWLLEQMRAYGARYEQVVARLVGGADMFRMPAHARLQIGRRNVEALVEVLARLQISVVASDVGGHVSRSVDFDVSTGRVWIRRGNGDERWL
ncbi:MAG: chemotaxis protein CheD [Thermoflavifilum sp.]|nr:chemotaxis protein CheD [Thermoflavifilum sp.]MCL6513400.1 chemotaxis protein CheD [Alicyclobacillus sp.]